MKEKKKERGNKKEKRWICLCVLETKLRCTPFFCKGVVECSSSREQSGYISLQNWRTFLLQPARSYVNCEMFWQSPESHLCEVLNPGLGSTSNAVNICVSSVEWIISVSISSFSLLLCFCSVQFAEVLRHSLFDGTGGVRRALSDHIALWLFPELLQGTLGKLVSSVTFWKHFLMSKEFKLLFCYKVAFLVSCKGDQCITEPPKN